MRLSINYKMSGGDETKVRGFMCPVTIQGNPALIALAYESGFGEKNSLGFGMLEVEPRQPSTELKPGRRLP